MRRTVEKVSVQMTRSRQCSKRPADILFRCLNPHWALNMEESITDYFVPHPIHCVFRMSTTFDIHSLCHAESYQNITISRFQL